MNKEERVIVEMSLETLYQTAGIKGTLKESNRQNSDGKIDLHLDQQTLTLNTEVKKELRQHQLSQILLLNEQKAPFLLVAERLFPKIKEELKANNISYLESNGNIFLKHKSVLVWIDSNKPTATGKLQLNRAFTKAGLQIIFHFLLDPDTINLPYRKIAERTNGSLGNINYVISGLKELNFLIQADEKSYKLINKKQLLGKWIGAYHEKLKPALAIGRYRFLKKEDFGNWKSLKLTNKSIWGGEAAGEILTHYLQPEEITLYTEETRGELMKNYKLVPDEQGNVVAYRKFWTDENEKVVPPLLAYADLIHSFDKRCTETAEKIYDELLKDQF